MPIAIVSLVPGVKPVRLAVLNVVQELGAKAGTSTLRVTETYSLIGVPPPIAIDPVAVSPETSAVGMD